MRCPGFLLVFLAGVTAQQNGLTLTIYDNNARIRSEKTTTVVISGPSFTFNNTNAFAADIEGSITFETSGVYEFNCSFVRTTTAYVWVDGHMVCQDNNAFHPGAGIDAYLL